MSGESKNDIKVLDKSPDYFNDIIQKKDISFFLKITQNLIMMILLLIYIPQMTINKSIII